MSFPHLAAWLPQSLRAASTTGSLQKRLPRVSLRLEELEPRTTPSVTVVPQQFATNQYTALSITERQLLAGDSASGPLKVTDPTQPAHAALVDNHNGTFTFTPEPSFTGSTSFQYTVSTVASQSIIAAADPDAAQRRVSSISVSGDTAVVGATEGAGNTVGGAAYVFVRSGDTWTEQAKLISPDPQPIDGFGFDVSVSGDTAIVGTFGFVEKAFVFVRSGTSWSLQATLTTTDLTPSDTFGRTVSISGDTIVIGDEFKTIEGRTERGAAYVFVRSGTIWTQQVQLIPKDESPTDGRFGNQVSLDGDTAVIGGYFQASAHVFVRSGTTWSQQANLTSPDTTSDNAFGNSVAVDNDTAVIRGANDSRTTYVFVRTGTTWTLQAKLPVGAQFFGRSLAVTGDTAVIGTENGDTVAVFQRSGNTWGQPIILDYPHTEFNFGVSVGLSGDTVLIGPETDQGAIIYAPEVGAATATATVQVNPATAALSVSPDTLPSGMIGSAYTSPTFTASGGAEGSTTFQQSGILPRGLTFDAATAQLVGTPVQAGSFPGIVIAASDGQGGSGSQTYTLTINAVPVHGFPVPFPQEIYAPPTSKAEPNTDNRAFIRGLYHSTLNRDVESSAALSYWETILTAGQTNPQQFGLPFGADPFLSVAQGFWTSEEHRWRQIESYYHDFLGRDLDPSDAHNLSEREYWRNQFLLAGAQEADVIRGFLTSPEYLLKHRGDAALANVLNTDLLAGAATAAHQQDWNGRLSSLDAQRVTVKNQGFATPEDYKAQLAAQLGAYADETAKTGVLFDVLGSQEYGQAVVDSFYFAMLRRAATPAEKQSLFEQRDLAGQPLGLGTIAEQILASAEYRQNATNSVQ